MWMARSWAALHLKSAVSVILLKIRFDKIMTQIVIILLTVFLILDCLFLGLLILVQLPKKDAGVGMAFGGGAADALFGAGSGTALTQLTQYSARPLFALVFVLSYLNIHVNPSPASELKQH